MNIPKRVHLANLPTPIQELRNTGLPVSLYIKRDDFTGIETSGNKIRKLEFVLRHALDTGCDTLITCGGLQSNHCRATAAIAAAHGLKSHLVLRGTAQLPDGNYFMDQMFGAEFTYVTPEEYKNSRAEIMQGIANDCAAKGSKAYIIPEGASFGMGLFGYYNAYHEILAQEKELGITFDAIAVTDGSGGTFSGLYLANELCGGGKKIIGFTIYEPTGSPVDMVKSFCNEAMEISGCNKPVDFSKVYTISDYFGKGYGIASDEVRAFIKAFAMQHGVLLDPVYTGKAMYGLFEEIKKDNPHLKGNVLFIHTGGLFGLFPQKDLFYGI